MRTLLRRCLYRLLLCIALLELTAACYASQKYQLKNARLVATFGPGGLTEILDRHSGRTIRLARDEFSCVVDGKSLDSQELLARIEQRDNVLAYLYRQDGYSIRVSYELHPSWNFVSKRIEIDESPKAEYALEEVQPLRLTIGEPVEGSFTPSTYLPQFGPPPQNPIRPHTTQQYGIFLRLKENQGLMLAVQNPFLKVSQNDSDASILYRPDMSWRKDWGPWFSDVAVIGVYQQSGERIPSRMVYEWKPSPSETLQDGVDINEIQAYADCVRQFLIRPSPDPISVEVGWTFNDYQIDIATGEGRAEYKRAMDTASELGIQYLLFAPSNHELASMEDDVDTWGWEHVLWLGLGQKIRRGEWDVDKSSIPSTITDMLVYAKRRHLGVLAYVYPSLPFANDSNWIVSVSGTPTKNRFATLASREFQDFLIHQLIAFKRRTGIAGYSFDYTFLNVPGSSAYAQWRGWRRVLEAVRLAEPDIIIDGRQTYQIYGVWTWLAGSYPHPTGNDEQAESFVPYPDLHFDRVSANRTRFVNYWYRNYQFAPEEIIPGYMTHQTPRNREALSANGSDSKTEETVYTPFRRRDWDYLGYKYSVLSSIATGGWNNVFDMIPGRDSAEFEHFSEADKSWIRQWLEWTRVHKEWLRHTKSILGPPAMGRVDGTAAILGDRGYVFLFNPNYTMLRAEITWDASTGLTQGSRFVLKELYPEPGKFIGNPRTGVWSYGDTLSFDLEGTSAIVLELVPAAEVRTEPLVFGARSSNPPEHLRANVKGRRLTIDHALGKVGSKGEISILLDGDLRIQELLANGKSLPFVQHGDLVSAPIQFAGPAFSHSQEVELHRDSQGFLSGAFEIPNRIGQQLAERRKRWPLPWTKEDYETTWLVPERLLLFVQIAEPNDAMDVRAEIDGSNLVLTRAYASICEHSPSFVGWYADLSNLATDTKHSIRLTLPDLDVGRFQGVFFDNVEDEYTEQLAP